MRVLRSASGVCLGLLTAALVLRADHATAQPEAGAGGGASAFMGIYRLHRLVTVELTAPWPLHHVETTPVTVRVGPSSRADMRFSMHTSIADCTLDANRVSPREITFPPGQTCSQNAMGRGMITGTVVTGTGRLDGAQLVLDLRWTLTGTLMGGAVSGTGVDHVTGHRAH
jgi:hypothetical protein